MTGLREITYWMALAHLPGWRTAKINSLIVEITHNRRVSLAEFFELSEDDWQNEFQLSVKESADLVNARSNLPGLSLLAEELEEAGCEVIPINSAKYSGTLKKNLTLRYSPPLLYIKGDKQLLQKSSAAIIGSRDASEISLRFTKTVAKKCAENYKIVVSGFARGVDKQALESTLEYHGRSIIVLPQGIMTFAGFRKYHSQIIAGNVLVLSAYFPKSPWGTSLAIGRNTYIYGLANEIYIAESGLKGGTWSGAMDGLRKGRRVYVRKSAPEEKNGNNIILSKGAIPMDSEGNCIGDPELVAEQLEMQFGAWLKTTYRAARA